MKIVYFITLWTAVWAEPPVPEVFAGYERGGYEIHTGDQKTFPGADQLNFPGVSDVIGGSRSGHLGGGGVSDDENSAGQRDDLGAGDRGRGRFEGGNEGEEEGGEGSLDDIPGVAGKDYPIYGEIPTTSFSCDQQTAPGYYADVEAQCQVFHICQKGGQKNSVLCPNGTVFNQRVFVCSWWYDFDCDSAPGLFSLNEQNSAEADAATVRGAQGGGSYTKNGPEGGANSVGAGGYTDDSQNFDQNTREVSENDINAASFTGDQNSFGGYQENRPRPAKITKFPQGEQNGGVSEQENGSYTRGSGGFSAVGQNRGNNNAVVEGYSENGPKAGLQERSRNDLTTSGGFSGRNGGDSLSTGYPSGREGPSGSAEQGVEVSGGYARERNGNTGRSNANGNARYEAGDGDGQQRGAIRDQSSENGYSSAGVDTHGNRDGLDQSSQYLPPVDGASGSQNGAGGFKNDATRTSDRSYLPPS